MHLYEKPTGVETRWFSPENPAGERGKGGLENLGSKGRAFIQLAANESATLMELSGSGTICRIWATISDRSPEMLRGLRLDMYWDGALEPAVSVPFGDFFGIGLGRRTPFECALFSDPEGRSFNCNLPMPFRTGAQVILTNESGKDLGFLFYDIDALVNVQHSAETLYFHAGWRRECPNALGQEFAILPRIKGSGRFLGSNLGVIADARYEGAWWGEGEVKVRFGGETAVTLCGTGTEDYIGTAWGQGKYANRSQGCPVADGDARQWAFYRYHLDDPIFFDDGIEVTIQTIGGTGKPKVLKMVESRMPVLPITVDADHSGGLVHLLSDPQDLATAGRADGWCNFWRQDDWSATSYFYLDQPAGVLPPIRPGAERFAGLPDPTSLAVA